MAVIKLLGEVGEKGARMAEIADGLGLKTSTAHRIVSALERHGLIEREQATKRYRLGLALFSLGAAAADGTGLRKVSRPALLRLAAQTGDTVFLMARSGFNVVCVDRQEGSYVLDSLTGHVGGQIPMGVGPASQAILAFLPAEEAEIIINANAPLYGRYNGLTADCGAGSPAANSGAALRPRPWRAGEGDLGAGAADPAPGTRRHRVDRHQHDERAARAGSADRTRRALEGRSLGYRADDQSAGKIRQRHQARRVTNRHTA